MCWSLLVHLPMKQKVESVKKPKTPNPNRTNMGVWKWDVHRAIDEKNMIFLCINGDYLWWMTSVLCSLFSTSSRLGIAANSDKLQERRQQGFVDTVQPPPQGRGGFGWANFSPAQGVIHAGHEWPLCSAVCFPPQADLCIWNKVGRRERKSMY
jgi:hypothetical protein